MSDRPKCGCGNTNDPDGYCDGSHLNLVKEEKKKLKNKKKTKLWKTLLNQELT